MNKSKQFVKANSTFMIVVGMIAFFFIFLDFYKSIVKSIPMYGITGYLIGAIFHHKISEMIIGFCWFYVSIMKNYEKLGEFPSWMSEKRYGKFLYYSSIVMVFATVEAMYAWTLVNFGTHSTTTNYKPLIFNKDPLEVFVWRYYLAGLVVVGIIYVIQMMKKGLKLMEKSS